MVKSPYILGFAQLLFKPRVVESGKKIANSIGTFSRIDYRFSRNLIKSNPR